MIAKSSAITVTESLRVWIMFLVEIFYSDCTQGISFVENGSGNHHAAVNHLFF